jgi:hypothetical protein
MFQFLIYEDKHNSLNAAKAGSLVYLEYILGVHGSVHRNINLIERTNKMRPCSRIYYSTAIAAAGNQKRM